MRSFENENLINTLWIGEFIKQKVKKDIVIIEENKYAQEEMRAREIV